MSRRIEKEVGVGAPVDEVWRALTDAEQLTRWFPVDARVQPGCGGSIWLSWGSGAEASAPITAWEPPRHLQWTETRGPVKLAVDFHLEARGGATVVRLVHSGFGDAPDWDDEFHMTEGGWSYFLAHLRWYLERHRGTPRDLVAMREPVRLSRADAFARLVRALGLSSNGSSVPLAGAAYDSDIGSGRRISGEVVASSPVTQQLGLTIRELGNAILFIEIEPDPGGARAGFWLSTYGLGPEILQSTKDQYSRLYRDALGL